jgi:hypothetical protein
MTGTTRVLIGTRAYGGMVHWGYMQSIMQYLEADTPVAVSGIGNESLIPRSRNTILSSFYHRVGFSHLLFLDSDVYLPAPGLKRLLGQRVDFMGAAVALKGVNDRGERVGGQKGAEVHAPAMVERAGIGNEYVSRPGAPAGTVQRRRRILFDHEQFPVRYLRIPAQRVFQIARVVLIGCTDGGDQGDAYHASSFRHREPGMGLVGWVAAGIPTENRSGHLLRLLGGRLPESSVELDPCALHDHLFLARSTAIRALKPFDASAPLPGFSVECLALKRTGSLSVLGIGGSPDSDSGSSP